MSPAPPDFIYGTAWKEDRTEALVRLAVEQVDGGHGEQLGHVHVNRLLVLHEVVVAMARPAGAEDGHRRVSCRLPCERRDGSVVQQQDNDPAQIDKREKNQRRQEDGAKARQFHRAQQYYIMTGLPPARVRH